MRLFTCEVNLEDFSITRHEGEHEEYPSYGSAREACEAGDPFGGAGYASLDLDEPLTVYAESVVSREDADRLVRDFCRNMAEMFIVAAGSLEDRIHHVPLDS